MSTLIQELWLKDLLGKSKFSTPQDLMSSILDNWPPNFADLIQEDADKCIKIMKQRLKKEEKEKALYTSIWTDDFLE